MKSEKDETVITLTEEELERIIKTSIKVAMNELKEEEKLPGNEVDEREQTPASFSLLENISGWILWGVIIFSALAIIACINMLFTNGFDFLPIIMACDFGVIISLCVSAFREIQRTKKLEVLNTIFSAIMALSTLLVAIISAYFAYRSIGGGMS